MNHYRRTLILCTKPPLSRIAPLGNAVKLILSRLAFLAAALALALPSAAAADDNCTLHRVASLDMSTDEQGDVVVPMKIGGQTFNMLVDTGGFGSMITESTAKKLGLESHRTLMESSFPFQGTKVDHYVDATDVDFGGLKARTFKFFTVVDRGLPSGVDGLLGPELLLPFDADFDFANGKLNLIDPNHCRGKVVYWTAEQNAGKIPMRNDFTGHITLNFQLDGHTIKAIFDTGAPFSWLSFDTARDIFGIDPKSPDLKKTDVMPHAARYPFKTLQLGELTVQNPDFVMVPDEDAPDSLGLHALIGMNIIRTLHLYIAYHEQMLYVSAASAH